jgi:hypothetical protein
MAKKNRLAIQSRGQQHTIHLHKRHWQSKNELQVNTDEIHPDVILYPAFSTTHRRQMETPTTSHQSTIHFRSLVAGQWHVVV